jgi:hypothetical protein
MRRAVSLILVGLLVFLAAVLSRLPASLVLDRLPTDLTYASASGILWRGELEGVRFRGQPVGRVTYRLKLLPLLTGRAAGAVTAEGPSLSGRGSVSYSAGLAALSDFTADLDFQGLGLRDFFGAPLAGSARIDGNLVRFGPQGCEEAAFNVTSDVLVRSLDAYGGDDLVLNGRGACEDGGLLLPLSADGEQGAVDVRLTLSPGGEWVSSMRIAPADPRVGSFLQGAGFTKATNGAWSIERRGMVGELL